MVVGDLVGMLTAIDLYDQASVGAEEIEDVGTKRNLPLPAPTTQATGAQRIPKPSFSISIATPHRARPLGDDPDDAKLGHPDALLQQHHLDVLELDGVTFALQGDVAALYR